MKQTPVNMVHPFPPPPTKSGENEELHVILTILFIQDSHFDVKASGFKV